MEKKTQHRLLPAAHVIAKCGGPAKTAEFAGRDRTSVGRWMSPKEVGGTGGLVPSECQQVLLDRARAEGIDLTPNDFFVSEPATAAE